MCNRFHFTSYIQPNWIIVAPSADDCASAGDGSGNGGGGGGGRGEHKKNTVQRCYASGGLNFYIESSQADYHSFCPPLRNPIFRLSLASIHAHIQFLWPHPRCRAASLPSPYTAGSGIASSPVVKQQYLYTTNTLGWVGGGGRVPPCSLGIQSSCRSSRLSIKMGCLLPPMHTSRLGRGLGLLWEVFHASRPWRTQRLCPEACAVTCPLWKSRFRRLMR